MTYRFDAATTLRVLPATRRARRGAAVLTAAAALVVMPAASAQASAGVDAIWMECIAGAVSPNHSMADYQAALVSIPADVAEYGDCASLIKAAELAATRATTAPSTAGAMHAGQGGRPVGEAMIPQGKTVAAPALATALEKAGVNAAAPAGQAPSAPSPADREASLGPKSPPIDLAAARTPSIAGVVALPAPLLAAAGAVLLMSLLPLARKIAGRLPRRRGE